MSLSFDPQAFDWVAGLVQWLVVCLVVGVLGWATAALMMFLQSGAPGLAQLVNLTLDMFRDFFGTSPRRVWALAVQTFREAWRGKLLWIFAIAAVLFMFAGMLLPSGGKVDPEISTKSYVSFVWKAVTGLSVPLVLLLACWGLPQDIRLRSLHTVVTKPVRRHEIILGRILGLLGIGTAVLLVVGALGYVWVVRQHMGLISHLPEAQRQPLSARVPVFAEKLSFLTREGGTTDETGGEATGVNVGDVVMFRSFVEGNTKARAIWRFNGLQPSQFQDGRFLLDSSFQSFRTHKGKIDRELLTQYTLINPTNGLRVRLKVFKNREFRRNTYDVMAQRALFEKRETGDDAGGRKGGDGAAPKAGAGQPALRPVLASVLVAQAGGEGAAGGPAAAAPQGMGEVPVKDEPLKDEQGKPVSLEELLEGGVLDVEVACLSTGQFLGMARPDLFVRLPDRPFLHSYVKGLLSIFLMMTMVIVLGVMSGCFLKFPVAFSLTMFMFLVGIFASGFFTQLTSDKLLDNPKIAMRGRGMFESLYRLPTHLSPTVEVDDSLVQRVIKSLDQVQLNALWGVRHLFPDFTQFNHSEYVANTFDVPWREALLPNLATTFGFCIPWILVGYFALKSRELEAK